MLILRNATLHHRDDSAGFETFREISWYEALRSLSALQLVELSIQYDSPFKYKNWHSEDPANIAQFLASGGN